MENLSHSRHPNRASRKACNGNASFGGAKAMYDDVYGGAPKSGVPTLSPRAEDYSEIFGCFNASRASSIPVLDLPEVDEAEVFFDVRSSGFDYFDVFGGFEASDFAASYEDLFGKSMAADCSSDEAWTPAETESYSGETYHSGDDPCFSIEDPYQSFEGNTEFNISYHKAGQSAKEDLSNGLRHAAQVQAVPGYTFLVDQTGPLAVADDISHNTECNGVKQFRKVTSNSSHSSDGREPFGIDFGPQGGYANACIPSKGFVTISEISLQTEPSHLPPPSRPPPFLDIRKVDSCISTNSDGTASDSSPPFFDVEVDASSSAAASAAAMKEAMKKAQAKMKSAKELMERKKEGFQGHTKPDSVSSINSKEGHLAGRSAEENNRRVSFSSQGSDEIHGADDEWKEATQFFELVRTDKQKRAVEQTNVEQFLEQHADVLLHGHMENRARMETTKSVWQEYELEEANLKEDFDLEGNSGRPKAARDKLRLKEHEKMNGAALSETCESFTDLQLEFEFEQARKNKKSEHKLKEAGVRRENEKKCRDSLNTDNREIMLPEVFDQENNEKRSQEALQQDEIKKLREATRRSEKKKLKEARERAENEKILIEALKQLEDKKILEDALQQEEKEKKLKETREWEERERRQRKAREREEDEKRLIEAHAREENEKRLKAAREREETERRQRKARELEENKKKLKEARVREENEKRLKEARAREENEQRLKEVCEREENETRLKEAREREENEKRLKEAREREENEKRLKEAREREENEKKLKEACEREESERRQKEAREIEENLKRLKEAREREQNEKKLKEAREREENEKKLKEAREREEIERRRKREAREIEENVKRLKEAREKEENEKKLKEAREREEFERRQREAREIEENLKRLKEAREREENERKLKEAREREEIEIRQKKAREIEENEKRLKEALEREENERKHKESREREENEKRLKEAREREEHEKRFKEAREREEHEKRIKEARERKENEKRLKEALERQENEKRLKEARERQENEKRLKEANEREENDKRWREALEQEGSVKKQNEARKRDDTERRFKESYGGEEIEQRVEDFWEQENNNKISKNDLDRKDSERKSVFEDGSQLEAGQPAVFERRGNLHKIDKQANRMQGTVRKDKALNGTRIFEAKESERIERERELEQERLRRIEEEIEREREREKDRMAVDRATLEARESAREKVERAAVERATAEARQRVLAEARERLEKACAEAREKSLPDKTAMEARLRAERAAVERATAEARERAAFGARERVERSFSDKFSGYVRNGGIRHSSSSSDLQDLHFQNVGSSVGSRNLNSSVSGASCYSERCDGNEGESAQRCRARLERHRRTAERAAKALAEKNTRDLLAQKEQAERNRLSETLDAEVKRWSSGKEGNLRALLSTLQYILGSDGGWQPIPLTEVITNAAVKKAYRKATLCVHPDKLQQRGANIHQKYICEKVFDLLKEAWNKFNSEER